jgi:Tol biopolymer transport system component/subtilisin family serine protease
MKNSNLSKILGITLVLIMLCLNIFVDVPVNSADIDDTQSKVSSLLSLHIKLKQAQADNPFQNTMSPLGIDQPSTVETSTINKEQVFLHFTEAPTEEQINDLSSIGVTIYPDSWIPPVNNFDSGFVLADMPIDQLDNLADKNYILSLDTAEQMLYPQNDQARNAMNVDPVWTGGDTGTGVTVAVIDSGIDTSNPDFPPLDPSNSKDYSNYPTLDDTITNTVTGHGTHVTGSLLGRGVNSATYKGVAPGANLVFLKVGNDTDGAATSSAVIYALRDAVDVYQAKIINLSMGTWSVYHDGSDQTCQAVDYATGRGASVFVSAGNDASHGWHYSGSVAAKSTTPDIPVSIAVGASSNLMMNLVMYFVGANDGSLGVEYYDGNHTPLSINSFGENSATRASVTSLLNNPVNSGTYYLRVGNNSSKNQPFHIYYMGGSTSVAFVNPDPNYTLDCPAEADTAIAVGAYVTRNSWTNYKNSNYILNPQETVGSIANFSGRGPRIDPASPNKPDIVAPGSAIVSVRDAIYNPGNTNYEPGIIDNDGLNLNGSGPANYYVMQGTSMACPEAAGVGALILSKNPDFTPGQVRHALEVTAMDKGNSGLDNIYGWGLVNAGLAINSHTTLESFADSTHTTPCDDFYNGTMHTVYVYGTGFLKNTGYTVFYYDGGDIYVGKEEVNSSETGTLSSQQALEGSYEGTWKAVVCEINLYANNYSFAKPCSAAVDTFTVERSAMVIPKISTMTASYVGTTAATLNGNLTLLRANSANIFFEWGTDTNYGNATPFRVTSNVGTFNSVITGLTPGMTYHYRAVADAGTGGIGFGYDSIFTTWTKPLTGKIVFAAATHVNNLGGMYEVYIMNADGTNQTLLTSVAENTAPSISKDGSKIAFVSRRDGLSQIYTMNSDGTNQTRLKNTDNNIYDSDPRWSPNGDKVVFSSEDPSDQNHGSDIYVMNSDGSNVARLTNAPGDEIQPTWSPDGTKIAFESSDGVGGSKIISMNSDGSNQVTLANGYYGEAPDWSPDGNKIVFKSLDDRRDPQIYVMNRDGSNIIQLTHTGRFYDAIWSLDGAQIALSGTIDTSDYGTWIMNSDGTNLLKLSETGRDSDVYSWANGSWNAPSVKTGIPDHFTSTGVTLKGDLIDPGSDNNVLVSFDWGTDTSYTGGNVPGEPASLPNPGSFTANLSGLRIGQTYHYRAKAVGEGVAYGEDVSFVLHSEKIVIITNPQTFIAGSASGKITIQTQDPDGGPKNVLANTDVNLSSTSAAGKFDTSPTGLFNGSITKITIPAGSNSASFYYKDLIAGTPTITASNSNYTSASQQETINPGSLDHYSVSNIGSPQTSNVPFSVTVHAQDAFNNNLTTGSEKLNITFGKPDQSASPTSINTSNGTATITNMTFTSLQTSQTITFTGATSGKKGTSNAFDVLGNSATKLTFVTSPQTIVVGSASASITIQSQNASNNPVNAANNMEVNLSSTSSSGRFDTNPAGSFNINKITIPVGNSSASFYYKDTLAGTPTITATNISLGSVNQQETINPGNLDHYAISNISSPQTINVAFGVTIRGQDAYNNNLTSGDEQVTMTLSKVDAGASPTSVHVANGTANISNMKLTVAQTGQTLTFIGTTSGKQGTSNSFEVRAAATGGGSGGSGGGGGGGGDSPPPALSTIAIKGLTSPSSLKVDKTGIVQDTIQLKSATRDLLLDINKYTKLLDSAGKPISTLAASPSTSPSSPPAQNAILVDYILTPDGAKFDPSLKLTLKYDPQTLPSGVNPDKIYLAYFDGTKWVTLDSTMDTVNHAISAKITHFSEYALLVQLPSPAQFTISDPTISSNEVAVSEPVTIQTLVSNTGESSGKYNVLLKISGEIIESREVTLDPAKNEMLTFHVKRDLPGVYNVDLNGEIMHFNVKAPLPPPTTPISLTPQGIVAEMSPAPSVNIENNAMRIAGPTGQTPAVLPEAKPNFPVWWLAIGILVVVIGGIMIGLRLKRRAN